MLVRVIYNNNKNIVNIILILLRRILVASITASIVTT